MEKLQPSVALIVKLQNVSITTNVNVMRARSVSKVETLVNVNRQNVQRSVVDADSQAEIELNKRMLRGASEFFLGLLSIDAFLFG